MRELSAFEVRRRIASGDVLVIFDGLVLKLNNWLPRHPGGDKAIQHMVGRDATAEMTAYHSHETLKNARKFAIARLVSSELPWSNLTPPIQGGLFREADFVDEGINLSSRSSSEFGGDEVMLDSANPDDHGSGGLRRVAAHEEAQVRRDLEIYPSLDTQTQAAIQQKYLQLGERLEREGFYRCYASDYGREAMRWLFLAACSALLYRSGWFLSSSIFLGLFWHQVTFFGHDAGHTGITHSHTLDAVLGVSIASCVGGLSIGWWKRNHNVHHLTTNSARDDPDIQHMPIFAVTPTLLTDISSTYYDKTLWYDAAAKLLVKVQQFTFYPIMLFGRFNLYRLSFDHIIFDRGPKTTQARLLRLYETFGIAFFWYWFGYKLVYCMDAPMITKMLFVLISHWTTSPLHVQITLSHFAMSTADLGPAECFAQRQLRTTMDVRCPPWLDCIHGGLQFQAIHHLFPRLPRHRLRNAQPLVREFCKETGIPYREFGFVEGNNVVLSRLAEVSGVAKDMARCLRAMKTAGDYGMNLAE
ncbi:hypothetical protein PYCC9005_003305 [Savitreella phatthalungensis]